MSAPHQIQYLTRAQIDTVKWDNCIDKSPNGLIYGYSFYLDAMAKHWDALVLGDYAAVMPLTWKKKYGFHYLYQPAFVAQSGVFGKNLDHRLINSFINAIPKKFRLVEINLNCGNTLGYENEFNLRQNFFLSLNQPYLNIAAGYRENHTRNIKKTFQSGCTVKKDIAIEEIITINKEIMKNGGGLPEADYENFKKLFYLLKQKQQAETYAIVNAQSQAMASCVFFHSHNRAYYILVGNTPDGKTIGASHALIDTFIKDNAGKSLTLDFEGSDIRNLAFFYSGFGAKEEQYPFLKINKLPFYFKWLKK